MDTEITSSPASGSTYRYGETIDFSITFSAALDVDGTKHLNLRVGADRDNNWRVANYKEGSGTNTLVFGYTVQPYDLDDDGITLSGSYIQNGEAQGFGGSGTITVSGTEIVVPPDFSGLSDQSGHKVNGQPYQKAISITSIPEARTDTYGLDEIIRVSASFDQNVDADEMTHAWVAMDSGAGMAVYSSGSGTDTLKFEYKVQSFNHDDNGISVKLGEGLNIKASGTQIDYESGPGAPAPALLNQSGHKVEGSLDRKAPAISSLVVISDPGEDNTYGAGDEIEVRATFSEDVRVTRRPQLEIDVGGTARSARYERSGDSVFRRFRIGVQLYRGNGRQRLRRYRHRRQ